MDATVTTMGLSARRWRAVAIIAVTTIFAIHFFLNASESWNQQPADISHGRDGELHWRKLPDRYPVETMKQLPSGKPKVIPTIQAKRPMLSSGADKERRRRLAAVKESFVHSWAGYKSHAWLKDEVIPIKGGSRNTFGGWAATLVDSLDTIWIMGLFEDFEQAVNALDELDFTYTDDKDINVFETTIRYLGGFLAAYDLSEGKYPKLLKKAKEVGDFLMCAFDTPNHMPISRWPWRNYMAGNKQIAPTSLFVSELGSLSLEFTRLSQLTGDPQYYDAVARISDLLAATQFTTRLPGMWPVIVNAAQGKFDTDSTFTLGGMSDSLYEYLPKQYLLLGGLLDQPRAMYEKFLPVAEEHLFFRPLNPQNLDILIAGDARAYGGGKVDGKSQSSLFPRGQHLSCFAGGMVAIASKIFSRPGDLETARKLTDGCAWVYASHTSGIAPELFDLIPCNTTVVPSCTWDEAIWHKHIPLSKAGTPNAVEDHIARQRLSPGFTFYADKRYILRPEAIESIFILYRVTGDAKYMDIAWEMFQSIERACRTAIASSAIYDVTVLGGKTQKIDSMESFWLAETLKYFYLVFSEWDVVSLDEWVFNTEAHPLKRPT